MELSKNTRVRFVENPHSYILDDNTPLMGVTSLMKKHGLSPDYGGIDEAVLAHAAALGSQAHQTIENVVNGLPYIETSLTRSFTKLGLNIIATEYLVSDNETVASSVDLVEGVGESSVILWDMKRTSTVHCDALSWQLGIYKYLFEKANPAITVVGCKCLPLKKGNKDDVERDVCGTPVDITPASAAEVERLLQCDREGMWFVPAEKDGADVMAFSSSGELSTIAMASRKLMKAQRMVKEAEEVMSEFKDRAYQYMLEHDLDQMKCGDVVLKLKRPYTTTRLDSTKFKKEHPELAEKYIKVTETKGNISININS